VTAVEPTTTDPTPTPSRRGMLCGLVVALLAPGALVAACSSDSTSGGGGGSTPTGGGTTGGGSSGSSGSSGSTALAALADVPQGGGLVVNNPSGGKILLTRPSGDEIKAYNASCTHQGTIVDPPKDGKVTCPNHGSQFDPATGQATRGPAVKALSSVGVKVDGADIVLA
jgi:cytochrome b6-f complex iron-sulfur subunit